MTKIPFLLQEDDDAMRKKAVLFNLKEWAHSKKVNNGTKENQISSDFVIDIQFLTFVHNRMKTDKKLYVF